MLDTFDYVLYRFNCMTIERPSEHLRQIFGRQGYVLVKEIRGLDSFYVHEDFIETYKANLFSFWQKRFVVGRWS